MAKENSVNPFEEIYKDDASMVHGEKQLAPPESLRYAGVDAKEVEKDKAMLTELYGEKPPTPGVVSPEMAKKMQAGEPFTEDEQKEFYESIYGKPPEVSAKEQQRRAEVATKLQEAQQERDDFLESVYGEEPGPIL